MEQDLLKIQTHLFIHSNCAHIILDNVLHHHQVLSPEMTQAVGFPILNQHQRILKCNQPNLMPNQYQDTQMPQLILLHLSVMVILQQLGMDNPINKLDG